VIDRDPSRKAHLATSTRGAVQAATRTTKLAEQPVHRGPGAAVVWLLCCVATPGTSAVIRPKEGVLQEWCELPAFHPAAAIATTGGNVAPQKLHGGDTAA